MVSLQYATHCIDLNYFRVSYSTLSIRTRIRFRYDMVFIILIYHISKSIFFPSMRYFTLKTRYDLMALSEGRHIFLISGEVKYSWKYRLLKSQNWKTYILTKLRLYMHIYVYWSFQFKNQLSQRPVVRPQLPKYRLQMDRSM